MNHGDLRNLILLLLVVPGMGCLITSSAMGVYAMVSDHPPQWVYKVGSRLMVTGVILGLLTGPAMVIHIITKP